MTASSIIAVRRMVPCPSHRRYAFMGGRKQSAPKPNRISEHRTNLGLTQPEVGDALGGVHWTTISSLENGKQRLTTDWMNRLAPVLKVRPADLLLSSDPDPQAVPLVGYVSAGAEAVLFSDVQGNLEHVQGVAGMSAETVAVEIRGDSLGSAFNGWLAFYDDIKEPPTADLIGRLCVVELDDGRMMAKELMGSSLAGRYSLKSPNMEPLYGVSLNWAARILFMRPK